MNYYLGIDCGGTFIKALLINQQGEFVDCVKENIGVLSPQAGYAERDMSALWQSCANVINKLITQAGIFSQQIKCVGISAQGKGAFLLDKNHRPLGNAILSSDQRAYTITKIWKEKKIDQKCYALTAQHLWSGHPVSILKWIKENEPKRYSNIGSVLMSHDYLRFCLTGELYCEESNISESNFYNIHTRQYDIELLRLFDIEETYSVLPPIIKSNQIAGYITKSAAKISGLSEGTPVVGGAFDVTAAILCADIKNEKTINTILGTWNIVSGISSTFKYNEKQLIHGAYNGKYLVHDDSPTSIANLEWFLSQWQHKSYDQINLTVSKLPPVSTNILFVPFLYGSNFGNLPGGIYGLQTHHTQAHLLQAIYEGVIFALMHHINRVKELFHNADRLCVMGGITKSTIWLQMLADISGMELEILDIDEAGCLGAALLAMQGCNINTSHILEKYHRHKRYISPNSKNISLYRNKYTRYLNLISVLNDMDSKEIAHGR
ncbi:FGGY-family carbohydrate kinase [Rodentibacter haemolyticus]|uniref:Carbohydrate kinase n=1 Tax=Rodentibacter haemolyticus TaxID=2778911 RepID=A0ABX6UWI0_9PAST|nr:FGGY-family carbohydrate kinase [Rodentibacter haemolyticus]QPB41718.1 carbohydrate kinase [Rodentibacter haemolyticus]